MEDYHVANFINVQDHELGLFAIYDGHMGPTVPAYLQKHLFSNILKEVNKKDYYFTLLSRGQGRSWDFGGYNLIRVYIYKFGGHKSMIH